MTSKRKPKGEFKGEVLREFRAQLGVKNAYLSRQLLCSVSYVDKMLAGRVPGKKMLERVAQLLGRQEEDLIRPVRSRRAS